MNNNKEKYRMTSDFEPREEDLANLMHEVAMEAGKKAKSAKSNFAKTVSSQISQALVREGFVAK